MSSEGSGAFNWTYIADIVLRYCSAASQIIINASNKNRLLLVSLRGALSGNTEISSEEPERCH